VLTETARRHLEVLVDDYGRILNRDRNVLELVLNLQAREVERRLTAAPPPAPRVFFSKDYDDGVNLPEGMVLLEEYKQIAPDGKLVPMPVTFQQQVCFLARGVDRKDVADDLARLSTMTEVYRFLHRSNRNLTHWHYTSLESGLHTSFPGHGGYRPEYDPRQRSWYRSAKQAGALVWRPPIVDATTGTIMLSLAMPVHRPDGSLAGVTGIDVPFAGIFKELKLPEEWSGQATILVVMPGQPGSAGEGSLVIVVQKSYQDLRQDWQTPVELEFLVSDDPAQLAGLMADALAGKSGVRRMPHRGRDAMWAHGACIDGQRFPVVIVPHDQIVAQAAEAGQYVLAKTVEGLKIAGIILLGAVVVVAIVAFLSSRSVTRPVRQLAQAAQKLSKGDYDTRVDIRTGDELQELGETFSEVGPKLAEREQMKRSLELAMEIQQSLLPQESPKLEGFDVAGTSVYCEETGGDYFDFIDLIDVGAGKLGIAVGDVTGHGIAAALLMASARGALRSHAGRHGGNLDELFRALNLHLVRDTGEGLFMTLFYGILDAETRSLCWTSAGHDPAFWLHRRSGKIEELPNTGIPLGVVEETAFEQAGPVVLGSGDVVLVGTDGIWEARNAADEMFGKQRLCELLSDRADSSAREIHNAVVSAVNDFRAAGPQEDDITLVVIKAL
jgi:sigma-B regulation protein RsbU (phosphoserine phosphatase)